MVDPLFGWAGVVLDLPSKLSLDYFSMPISWPLRQQPRAGRCSRPAMDRHDSVSRSAAVELLHLPRVGPGYRTLGDRLRPDSCV